MDLKKDSDELQQAIRNNQNLSKDVNELKDKLKKETEQNIQLQNDITVAQKNIKILNDYITNPPSGFPNISSAVADIILLQCKNLANYFIVKPHPSAKSAEIVEEFQEKYRQAVYEKRLSTYKLEYLLFLYPELEKHLGSDVLYYNDTKITDLKIIEKTDISYEPLRVGIRKLENELKKTANKSSDEHIDTAYESYAILENLLKEAETKYINANNKLISAKSTIAELNSKIHLYEIEIKSSAMEAKKEKYEKYQKACEEFISNPPICFPLLANAAADYIKLQCEQLEVYFNTKPNPSYKSSDIVREFKQGYADAVKKQKLSEYKLEYLLSLYPALEDILEADFNEIQEQQPDYKAEIDPAREYLSKEEWSMLSSTERNQRALDNYVNRHNKSKWQIGRDYELYIGFVYQNKGYSVDYIGSYAKFEDLGRDLICKKDDITLIIQCKYWSKEKQIHEKHINQLYGTTLAYAIMHNLPIDKVKSVLITNITLSPMAIQFAKILGVEYKENCEIRNFPRIKCNINHDEWGITKIYHLPMDQQYDRVQIKNKGEFFAYTVEEAENAGFRRAFKHRK